MSEQQKTSYIKFFWLSLLFPPLAVAIFGGSAMTGGGGLAATAVNVLLILAPIAYIVWLIVVAVREKTVAPVLQTLLGLIVGGILAIGVFFVICGAIMTGF